eukprot:jgi/Astpho2/7261/gw1.00113.40.1_t
MAITHSLPMRQWYAQYTEATSEWTLDYPPMFAWFEFLLSQVARFVDPAMLQVHNLNYDSQGTIIFQRFSVIISELVLVTAVLYMTSKQSSDLAWLLVLGSPGLLLVDHIHFQYNGMLLGLLLWSIGLLQRDRPLLGGVIFAVLVNMKHLFAALAPLYVVFLLRSYCRWVSARTCLNGVDHSSAVFRGPAAVAHFLSLAGSVMAVCAVSFGPFIAFGQLQQVLARLFPFGRGLCHAYWAANFWALYSAADKALTVLLPRFGRPVAPPAAQMTVPSAPCCTRPAAGGLVGVSEFAVLPQVSPAAALGLSAAAMLPCLVHTWRCPKPNGLLRAAAYCCLCSFMFGYHVHEKAILMVLIPLAVEAALDRGAAQQYAVLAAVGHFALMPLLFTLQEYPVKILLGLIYSVASATLLSELHTSQQPSDLPGPLLGWPQQWYLYGLVPLKVFCVLVHPFVFEKKLPFLPLLLTSTFCAVGVTCSW